MWLLPIQHCHQQKEYSFFSYAGPRTAPANVADTSTPAGCCCLGRRACAHMSDVPCRSPNKLARRWSANSCGPGHDGTSTRACYLPPQVCIQLPAQQWLLGPLQEQLMLSLAALAPPGCLHAVAMGVADCTASCPVAICQCNPQITAVATHLALVTPGCLHAVAVDVAGCTAGCPVAFC